MHPAAQFARRALSAGAAGRGAPPRWRRFVGRDPGDALQRWAAKSRTTPHDALSDREYQVLRTIGSGHTVSDIARDLGLSVKTVSTYRSRVLDKLGMRTNAELMRYVIENGLLDS
jgi:two-component system invasion response regulator UvrY